MAGTSIAVDRLDSWKTIASYLNCDVRTAIRWESERGLPVHRLPGGHRQSVFAWRREIDAWLISGHTPQSVAYYTPGTSIEEPAGFPTELRDIVAPGAVQSRPLWKMGFGIALGAMSLAVLLIAAISAFRPLAGLIPPRPVQMTRFTQVTHDGLEKLDLLTDGSQLFFNEEHNGRMALMSLSVDGGLARVLWNPRVNVRPEDISPDGRSLLALTSEGTEEEQPLWIVPLHGGVPWKLSNLTAHSAAWSPNGKILAYANGSQINLARDDGTNSRVVGSWNSIPEKLRWSPDGKRLRFLLVDPSTLKSSYWELAFTHGTATTELSSLPFALENCCGDWSQVRGKEIYFLTASKPQENAPIWLLRSGDRFWEPRIQETELRSGLSTIEGVAYSQPAQKLFVVSDISSRGALLQFDSHAHKFTYILPGISGASLDYSRDGQWVTYTRLEDNTLWVSRADGSRKRQLTRVPENVELPRWSPDGKWIAYMAKKDGNPWRIYLQRLDGGPEREASEGNDSQGAPTWSPDGKFLVYGNVDCQTTDSCAIRRIDLVTGRVQTLPGSEGLQTARWSLDGRFVAALQPERHQLFLFDWKTENWRQLASEIDGNDMSWSTDSRSVYVSVLDGDARIARVSIDTGQVETAIDLSAMDPFNRSEIADTWFAIAPDGSVVLRHWQHEAEIYAYTLKLR